MPVTLGLIAVYVLASIGRRNGYRVFKATEGRQRTSAAFGFAAASLLRWAALALAVLILLGVLA